MIEQLLNVKCRELAGRLARKCTSICCPISLSYEGSRTTSEKAVLFEWSRQDFSQSFHGYAVYIKLPGTGGIVNHKQACSFEGDGVLLEDRLRFVGSALIALIGAVLSGVEFLNLFGYWGIAVVAVLAPLLFGLSYRYLPERMPSVADEITRSTQLKKVSDKLDAHYQGVIDRIDQKWDYQPSDGEQIFMKGSPMQRPKGLEQDKKHLSSFDNIWNIYSNGPTLYTEYKQAEMQARNRILDELMHAEPTLSPRLQESLPAMVFDRIDYVMRTGTLSAPLFEAKAGSVGGYPMVYLDGKMMDVVGEHTWTVDKVRQLASRMDKMVWSPQILHDVVQKRDALAKLNRNRSDFLSAKEEIVRKARSVDYYLPELTNGECDDCRLLKDNLKSLRGGEGKQLLV